MSKRQFANFKITQIEKLFDDKRDKPDVLESILAELTHRTVPRAKDLKRRVLQALAVGQQPAAFKQVLQPVSAADLKFSAEYFLKGQKNWTLEERTEAAGIARLMVSLAKMIEKRTG